jgi:hypothetical protein
MCIRKRVYDSFSAEIAQLVEQWIEDPRVTSSNLVLGNHNHSFYRLLNVAV